MTGKSAAIVALELFQEPRLANRLAKLPLHSDVLSLIKIAAGDEDALQVFPPVISKDPEKAKSIAVFYLQQMLFRPSSTDLRLLGLNHGASALLIKDHKRWLLKWLHPDRNQNKWEQHYFKRVTEASGRLQNAEILPDAVVRRNMKRRVETPKFSATVERKILPLWPRIKRRLVSTFLVSFGVGAILKVYFSFAESVHPNQLLGRLVALVGY